MLGIAPFPIVVLVQVLFVFGVSRTRGVLTGQLFTFMNCLLVSAGPVSAATDEPGLPVAH